jgi:hypothetical protein
MPPQTAYKLFRIRADGSLGPLFIHRRQRIPLNEWLPAENHPTPGYTIRPWWHCTGEPAAPHLGMTGRAWYEVEMRGAREFPRPASQGGMWYLAEWIKVLGRPG